MYKWRIINLNDDLEMRNLIIRLKHIERHMKGQTRGNRLTPFNGSFGDWLVLHQLYKNVDHSNFLQLVSKLCAIKRSEVLLRRNETNIKFDLAENDQDV